MSIAYTSDLGLASAIDALGHEIQDELREGEDGRKEFGFKITPAKLQDYKAQYRDGKLLVCARSMSSSVKKLKRMLYGDRKKPLENNESLV